MTQSDAARAAGYAHGSPNALSVTAGRLMRHPEIQKAAYEHREARLAGPRADKAIRTLEGILDDETAPAAARRRTSSSHAASARDARASTAASP